MRHMSNRDRIARAAEEAKVAATERALKKTAKKPSATRSAGAAKSVRMKVIWEVRNPAGKAVKSFAYPDKADAEAAVVALTRSTGQTHVLRDAKVPME